MIEAARDRVFRRRHGGAALERTGLVVLDDELRRLRERLRDGKPAYTVFADATLAEIAAAMPSTPEQLRRVRGIGPAKLDQYGTAVLEVVLAAIDA
jgi:superfamily II DNA helicase RecQ